MKVLSFMVALLGLIAATCGTARAEAPILHRVQVHGTSVGAEFLSVDTSTCDDGIETRVHVEGALGEIVEDNVRLHQGHVSVVVSVFDRCAGVSLLSLHGGQAAGDEQLQINPSLKSASLRTIVPAETGTPGATVPVSIDLVWTGAGKPDRTSDSTIERLGDWMVVSHSSGAIREADASGSVVVHAIDRTPLPSSRGFIEKGAERLTEIFRD